MKNGVVAAAAYRFRQEIKSGRIGRDEFVAMMKQVKGIVEKYRIKR